MNKLDTYGDFIAKDRAEELELYAFCFISGEDIYNILVEKDQKLADEYKELMEWDDE